MIAMALGCTLRETSHIALSYVIWDTVIRRITLRY